MKSYFLQNIRDKTSAEIVLRNILPGQEKPWVLLDNTRDPIAYFNVEETLDGETNVNVQADISGRHYNEDAAVIEILKKVQVMAGGELTTDE